MTHERNTKVKEKTLQALQHEFEELKMSEDKSIDEFHGRMFRITNQCQGLDGAIEPQRIVKKFLRGLPPSFESKQIVIEEARNLNTYTLDKLVENLKNFESVRRKLKKEKSIVLSTVKEVEEKELESSNCSVEEFTYLTKQFEKFMMKRKPFVLTQNFSKGSSSIPRYPRNSDPSPTRNPISTPKP